MIMICNMGPHDPLDPGGEREYELRINRELICTFRHKRSDGLAVCLKKASEAVKKTKDLETMSIIEEFRGGLDH